MQPRLRKWRPNLIEDFKGHWRKAQQNKVSSVDGVLYRILSKPSNHTHTVNITDKTCTCRWGQYRLPGDSKSGCSHVVTALVHRANTMGHRAQLVPSWVARYRENVSQGKGEADGQVVLGHGAKLLFYKVLPGHQIDQLSGMESETPYRPDTVEDLAELQDRLKRAIEEKGEGSLETRRLQTRVTALELYENAEPVAVPMDFSTPSTPTSEPEELTNEFPDLAGDDHHPLRWAKSYLAAGFSIGKLIMRNKHPKYPTGDWYQYRDTPPTIDRVETWWGADDRDGRMCIFTGYGGLFVFDFSEGDDMRRRWQSLLIGKMRKLDLDRKYGKHIPSLGVVLTGGGGYHVYVKTDNPLPGGVVLADGVKGYGYGGLMVAPPSKHEIGGRYVWATDYTKISRVPDSVYQVMLEAAREL